MKTHEVTNTVIIGICNMHLFPVFYSI